MLPHEPQQPQQPQNIYNLATQSLAAKTLPCHWTKDIVILLWSRLLCSGSIWLFNVPISLQASNDRHPCSPAKSTGVDFFFSHRACPRKQFDSGTLGRSRHGPDNSDAPYPRFAARVLWGRVCLKRYKPSPSLLYWRTLAAGSELTQAVG